MTGLTETKSAEVKCLNWDIIAYHLYCITLSRIFGCREKKAKGGAFTGTAFMAKTQMLKDILEVFFLFFFTRK